MKSKSALEQAAVEMRAKLQYLDNAQVVAKSLENAEVRQTWNLVEEQECLTREG